MILTDGLHLVSDTSLEELHSFAQSIGLKREWYQDHRHPHYDIMATWRLNRALAAGAVKVQSREIVRRNIRK